MSNTQQLIADVRKYADDFNYGDYSRKLMGRVILALEAPADLHLIAREDIARKLYVADHGPRWATACASGLTADKFHSEEAYRRAGAVLQAIALTKPILPDVNSLITVPALDGQLFDTYAVQTHSNGGTLIGAYLVKSDYDREGFGKWLTLDLDDLAGWEYVVPTSQVVS